MGRFEGTRALWVPDILGTHTLGSRMRRELDRPQSEVIDTSVSGPWPAVLKASTSS
jgi:hypothetical protein